MLLEYAHSWNSVDYSVQNPPSFTIKYHRPTRASLNSILELRTNVTKLKDQFLIKNLINSKLKYRTKEARLIHF